MKKALYVLLVLAELLATFAILSALWNSTFYLAVTIIVIIWLALLVRLIPKMKKADDAVTKRKLYRKLIFVMASPIIVFIILVIVFIIRFSMVN